MRNNFDDAADQAANQTNQQLAADISAATGLDQTRLAKLFPTPQSQQNLQNLLSIVKSATSHNEQVAAFKQKVDTCADVGLTLIKAYMKIV
jgi:hypothetical protein